MKTPPPGSFLVLAIRALIERDFDPEDAYVNICWLPLLGPVALHVFRYLARLAGQTEKPVWVTTTEIVQTLGLDTTDELVFGLAVLTQHRLVLPVGRPLLLVRPRLPAVPGPAVDHLPPGARLYHQIEVA
jgi:hypothetical protein